MAQPNDALVEILQRPLKPYWQALGQFISGFSLLEVNMQLALWTFAHLSKPMARALLAGSTRIDAAMTLISKVAEAEKWDAEKKTELSRLFTQLGHINKIRNDLLHFGASPDSTSDEWTVSNKTFATADDQVRITKITVQTLSDLSSDVANINSNLVLLAWGDQMKPATRELFENTKHFPWRYTPPPQAAHGRKNRNNSPKQKRQPKPSPASRRKAAMKGGS